ncbi:hypothetical protein D3C71_2106600 [compost metagenome]
MSSAAATAWALAMMRMRQWGVASWAFMRLLRARARDSRVGACNRMEGRSVMAWFSVGGG